MRLRWNLDDAESAEFSAPPPTDIVVDAREAAPTMGIQLDTDYQSRRLLTEALRRRHSYGPA